MTEILRDAIVVLFVFLVGLSVFGFLRGNIGLIIFSYLASSFKTNLLLSENVFYTYFEPQYIIALIWLIVSWIKTIMLSVIL